jgi:hypothetical protein
MTGRHTVALFGESEKGEFQLAHFCDTLDQLVSVFGHPPDSSLGMRYAIQALMYQYRLIFFRVHEEGYSTSDYLLGLHFLQNRQLISSLSAICLPGVSNEQIIQIGTQTCGLYRSILITTEADLFDYLTL